MSHFDPSRGQCGATVASGGSASSVFGDDEIVSNSNETMSNPAMAAPMITLIEVQLEGHMRGAGSAASFDASNF